MTTASLNNSKRSSSHATRIRSPPRTIRTTPHHNLTPDPLNIHRNRPCAFVVVAAGHQLFRPGSLRRFSALSPRGALSNLTGGQGKQLAPIMVKEGDMYTKVSWQHRAAPDPQILDDRADWQRFRGAVAHDFGCGWQMLRGFTHHSTVVMDHWDPKVAQNSAHHIAQCEAFRLAFGGLTTPRLDPADKNI